MQLITLFRFCEMEIDAPGGATIYFSTDLPGDAMTVRESMVIPPTNGRHPYRLSLTGATKGKLYQVKIVPIFMGTAAIYSGKVYARVLGPAATPWAWYTVPVMETPVEWQELKLPIPVTSDQWEELKLPIPVTSDQWQSLNLPIPPTSDQWNEMPLPVRPTPVIPDWVQVPIDA
jgi:hypothetical protein